MANIRLHVSKESVTVFNCLLIQNLINGYFGEVSFGQLPEDVQLDLYDAKALNPWFDAEISDPEVQGLPVTFCFPFLRNSDGSDIVDFMC